MTKSLFNGYLRSDLTFEEHEAFRRPHCPLSHTDEAIAFMVKHML